jgi:hypothetical protein
LFVISFVWGGAGRFKCFLTILICAALCAILRGSYMGLFKQNTFPIMYILPTVVKAKKVPMIKVIYTWVDKSYRLTKV